jgi:hypothetical protein
VLEAVEEIAFARVAREVVDGAIEVGASRRMR